MKKTVILLAAVCVAACQPDSTPEDKAADDIAATGMSPADTMNDIADRFYARALESSPEIAYFAAIDIDRHDGISDNSPEALERDHQLQDAFLAELQAIDAEQLVGKPEWITKAMLEQELLGSVARRICRLSESPGSIDV